MSTITDSDLEILLAAGIEYESCCGSAQWRFRLCQYHQGFVDGWDASTEAIMRTATPTPPKPPPPPRIPHGSELWNYTWIERHRAIRAYKKSIQPERH